MVVSCPCISFKGTSSSVSKLTRQRVHSIQTLQQSQFSNKLICLVQPTLSYVFRQKALQGTVCLFSVVKRHKRPSPPWGPGCYLDSERCFISLHYQAVPTRYHQAGLSLLRVFNSYHQTLNPHKNEGTFLLFLLKELLVLSLPVCQFQHNEAVAESGHSLPHTGPCSCLQPGIIWPDSQKPNLPIYRVKCVFLNTQNLQMPWSWQ